MCGKCCNRSPEVELTETLRLSGDFVFWLCFSLSELPLSIKDWRKISRGRDADHRDLAAFIARRRLLERQSPIRFTGRSDSRDEADRVRKYVRISAMTLDLVSGRCDKLLNRQCSIYDRRPHTCKTVPFHYHLSDPELERGLDRFTTVDGFECDTSAYADTVLRDGRLTSERFALERSDAQVTVSHDDRWRNETARRILQGSDPSGALPSLEDIRAGSCLGVILVPIYLAWQIGVEIGLLAEPFYRQSIETHVILIEGLFRRDASSPLLGVSAKSREQLTSLLKSLTGLH